MKRKIQIAAALVVGTAFAAGIANAAEQRVTVKEAEAMVRRA